MSQFIEMFKEAPRIELGKMASFINGSAFKPEEWSSDGLPIVRIQNLTQDDSPYNYYDGDTTKKIVIDNGDMLVSWSATLGVFLWSKGKALLNQHIFKVSFDKLDVNKDFFVYAVKLALDKMSEVAHGSTMRHVVKKDFNEMIVANPSINGQESFALIAKQADKSGFDGLKSQFIEMFDFHELNFNSPSKDFESMCLDDTSSATKIPAAEYLQEGKYAVYDQAQEKDIAGYSNTEQGLCRNYPAVLFGDHSRVVKYINEPFFIGADGVKIIRPREDNLIPEFLYYDLKYHNIPNTGYNRHFKYIKMISLTKASLEEQSQFLSIAHQADKSGSVLQHMIAC